MMILIRVLAFVIGVGLTAAMANVNIEAAGGYGTPLSFVVLAMAAGVVVGSIVIGHSLGQKRWLLAFFLAIGMLSGEVYNFLSSADRVIFAAENAQAPLKDAKQRHDEAVEALASAKAEKPRPASRERLEAAEKAKADADNAAREQAALPGCRVNCAKLLTDAVNNAAREVEAARAELEDHDRAEAARLAALVAKAEAGLKAAPLPASATPFADRINWAPSDLDLLKAFCFAVALNGLAAALIAFAAHGSRLSEPKRAKIEERAPAVDLTPAPKKVATSTVTKLPAPKPKTFSVVDFGAGSLEPAPGDTLDFDVFFNAYAAAAKANRLAAYGPVEFVAPFKELCEAAGIRVHRRGEKVFLCDVKLAA